MYHGFAAPTDVLELADGRLVALEAASGAISEVTEGAGPRTPLLEGLKFPVSMAEAADGKLYVTQSDGTVVRVDLAAKAIEPVAKDLEGPEGIDVGKDGKLYVAEAKAGRLVSIDPKDGAKTVLAEGLKTGLPAAEGTLPTYTTTGVAVSKKDGSVYVASDITNAIYRIVPSKK
jgi:DNA-binding beta-propeller fold protein YncE